jgi:hypothetical protein
MKLILLLIFISLLGCRDGGIVETSCNRDWRTNQYEVYSTIIDKIYGNSNQTIIIFEKTRKNEDNFKLFFNDEWLKLIKKDFHDIKTSIADSFNSNNEQSATLEQKFNLKVPYKFVSETDFAEINSDYMERFNKFARKFPEAVSQTSQRTVLFSQPGFDENFSQAVVFVEIWNDRKSFFFLKKESCRWKIVKDNTVSLH